MNDIYTKHLANHVGRLQGAEQFKLARDLAHILDKPLFAYPKRKADDSYLMKAWVKMREKFYHDYCAIFSELGLPLPPLEPQFYEVPLMTEVGHENLLEVRRMVNHVIREDEKSAEGENKQMRDSLRRTMGMLPFFLGFNSLSEDIIVAKLNQLLIADGLKPLRPDYAARDKSRAISMVAPPQPIKLLVVDDDIMDLAKTLRALSGWPHVELDAYLYERHHGNALQKSETRTLRMTNLAAGIVNRRPHIVLMDEGLDTDIMGSEMIPRINGSYPSILFVANSGGSGKELHEVGAYGNCDKGNKLDGLAEAIRHLEKFVAA